MSARVRWWRRLQARVIAGLMLIGASTLAGSTWVLHSAVDYFESRVEAVYEDGDAIAQGVAQAHRDAVAGRVDAFNARADAVVAQLSGAAPEARAGLLRAAIAAHPSLVGAEREGLPAIGRAPEDEGIGYVADRVVDGRGIHFAFAIDPIVEERFQSLGARARALRKEREHAEARVEAGVQVVLLSGLLIMVFAALAAMVVARATTRRVEALSGAMEQVARGRFDARVEEDGRDEIGVLGSAFNHMLDELQVARRKVAYLERVSAWQEMARRIAHEIKNPLTPIQLAVQQLREKAPTGDPAFAELVRTSAEIVEDEVAGLRRMVQAFSSFAKVPEVHTTPLHVEVLISEFTRAYGHLTDERPLGVDGDGAGLWIEGDRQLLKQCLVNIVENARLSSGPSGSVRLVIEADASQVLLKVEDDGPGVPSDLAERVFEPYHTTREAGTGLGLAIVKKVVLDHGGEVWVQASPMGGACFVLAIPRIAAPRGARASESGAADRL